MTALSVAAVQFAMSAERAANLATAERLIRKAAAAGANIILLPELFELPYFCKDQDPRWFDEARPAAGNVTVETLSNLARELQVVLPVSFFERDNTSYFNTLALIDADGTTLGIYRKSHIPDGVGYQEKYYFRPGDTGFRVWPTRWGTIGVGICWDQWFPEAARAMVLAGAEVLLYPSAIGSEPQAPAYDSRDHWWRVMQGHAGANLVPLVASNRVGLETGATCAMTFYGSSFIAGPTGEILDQAGRDGEAIVQARFDLEAIRRQRDGWGIFRDRRPDLYGALVPGI